jgi:hypothetical protein
MTSVRPIPACPESRPTSTERRQDDNGNQFVVQTALNREEANRLVAELEARGHKQVYWAEPDRG